MAKENQQVMIDRLVFAVILGLVNTVIITLSPILGADFVNHLASGGFAGGVATLSALILGPTVKRWIDTRRNTGDE